MRDAAALGGRQLGGADVHAAVELHGVGVHDLAAEPLGDVERQGATCRCRSARRSRWVARALMASRPRRSNRRRTARRGTARVAAAGRAGQPGQHLVGDPADDAVGQRGSTAATSPAASASSSAPARQANPGRNRQARRGQGVRTVGDHQHADARGGVEFGAQRPAAGQRGVGRQSSAKTRTSAMAAGFTCPRTQPVIKAHSGSSPGRYRRLRAQRHAVRPRRIPRTFRRHPRRYFVRGADADRDPALGQCGRGGAPRRSVRSTPPRRRWRVRAPRRVRTG